MGKLVASVLGYQVLDVDSLIQNKTSRSVPQIFAEEGEQAFRDLESQVLQVRHLINENLCSARGCSTLA